MRLTVKHCRLPSITGSRKCKLILVITLEAIFKMRIVMMADAASNLEVRWMIGEHAHSVLHRLLPRAHQDINNFGGLFDQTFTPLLN